MLMRWCTDWPSVIRSHGLIIITNIIIMLCPLRDKYLYNAHLSHKSYLNKYRHCPAKDQIPLWTNDSFRRATTILALLWTLKAFNKKSINWFEKKQKTESVRDKIISKDLPVTLYLYKVPWVGVHGLPREHERALRATWTGADSTYDDGVLGLATPNGLVYKQSHDTNDSVAALLSG